MQSIKRLPACGVSRGACCIAGCLAVRQCGGKLWRVVLVPCQREAAPVRVWAHRLSYKLLPWPSSAKRVEHRWPPKTYFERASLRTVCCFLQNCCMCPACKIRRLLVASQDVLGCASVALTCCANAESSTCHPRSACVGAWTTASSTSSACTAPATRWDCKVSRTFVYTSRVIRIWVPDALEPCSCQVKLCGRVCVHGSAKASVCL